jgi:cystathionine beta-lyase/cystathionine gamma-synthase
MVDNTFATPVNQQPLALGADFAVHSATKYLGGHSDITAGVVMGSTDLLDPVRNWRRSLGQTPAPETAWLLARSLRTLVVRVKQQNQTAATIAHALQHHPRVTRVYYPGLEDSPDHALAKRQMSGFGGMLTLEVAGDAASASGMVDKLRLFALAPSLGGVESLVSQPVYTSHFDMSAAERERRGIRENMVRLSIGLEDPADLLADLEFALDPLTAVQDQPDK